MSAKEQKIVKTTVIKLEGIESVLSPAGVEKKMCQHPGIHKVETNFMTGTATVYHAEARKAIGAWRQQRPNAGGQFVFVGQRGDALQPRAVQRMLADYGRRASAEVTPHLLRHSFAKNLLNAGATIEKVAALMGHANLNTTRVYTTPSVSDLERAVDAIGN